MGKTKQEYLEELLTKIEKAKDRGVKGLYLMNEKVLDNTVMYIETYFKNNTEYTIDARKCLKCKNLWDIIIMFV